MDELGNTHSLQLAGQGSLVSHSGRCIRLTRWPVATDLRAWLGPSRGVCPSIDAPGGCESGPVPCSSPYWLAAHYVAPPPPDLAAAAQARKEPAQSERGGFGGTFWHLASTTLGRRRRGRRPKTSPFDLSTHYGLRQWSEAIDFFRYPGLRHFLSLASLLRQLTTLDVDRVNAEMQVFGAARRSTGLAAWRATLEAVVRDPSQLGLASP